MGRLSRSLLVLAVGAAAAVALASCGSSASPKLLPGATAGQINSNLDQVQRLVSENDCIGAENAAAEISNQVDELSGVDKKLKQALSEGAQRLNEKVVAGCEEEVAEESTEATETGEETETAEKNEKAEKEKAKSEKEPKEPKEPPVEPFEPPAHEEGGGNESPPVETGGGTPSGGIGPGAPAE